MTRRLATLRRCSAMTAQPAAMRPSGSCMSCGPRWAGCSATSSISTREQIARGHAGRTDRGFARPAVPMADRVLGELAPRLALGLMRLPMRRDPHPSDFGAVARVTRRIARAPARRRARARLEGRPVRAACRRSCPAPRVRFAVYTPHGGSLNYRPGLARRTASIWRSSGCWPAAPISCCSKAPSSPDVSTLCGSRGARCAGWCHNGIGKAEFVPVCPGPDAADFVYVGELRAAKGIDTLLEALARCAGPAPGNGPACHPGRVGAGPGALCGARRPRSA